MKARKPRRQQTSKKHKKISYHINEDLKDLIVVNRRPSVGPKEATLQNHAVASQKEEEPVSPPPGDERPELASKAGDSRDFECFNIVAIGNPRAYSSLRSPSSAEGAVSTRQRGSTVIAGRVPPNNEPAITDLKTIPGLRSSNVSSTQPAEAGRGSSRGRGNESVTGGSYSSSIRKMGNESLMAHVIGKRVQSR